MTARVGALFIIICLLTGPAFVTPAVAQTGAATPGSFDGVYKPTESHGMAKSRASGSCSYSMASLHVTNGVAAMKWRDQMQGPVAPDGKVNIGGPANMLTGQITNGVFTGKLETPACIFSITLAR